MNTPRDQQPDDVPFDGSEASDPGFRAFLEAYELPELGPERLAAFTDETCLRVLLHRHDPAAGAAPSAGFAERVCAAVLADRAPEPRALPQRAPATVELRSRLVPYLVAAVMLIATAVALIWPKGPGPTMPKIDNVATQLDALLRSASDPVSQIGGLVPVADFAQPSAEAEAVILEIPRFAPPSMHDFEAADLEARALEAAGALLGDEARAR